MMNCIKYVLPRLEMGKILDYGCGTGVFISLLNEIRPGSAVGYEPYMKEKYRKDSIIYSDYGDIMAEYAPGISGSRGAIATICIFEVIEHLGKDKLDEFLVRAEALFGGNGGVIIANVPVEIGPVLVMKELHRISRTGKAEYGIFEFLLAALFGIPGKRSGSGQEGYSSHKGFDFRKATGYFSEKGWETEIIGYSPLPVKCWYGNSQVFFKAEKQGESKGHGT
jgi:SAM-dependent methyltransferase